MRSKCHKPTFVEPCMRVGANRRANQPTAFIAYETCHGELYFSDVMVI